MLNRAMRRLLGLRTTPETVRLIGGPMDGWLVTPDAPSLRRDWWFTLPPTIGALWPSYGCYVRTGDSARWTESEQVET